MGARWRVRSSAARWIRSIVNALSVSHLYISIGYCNTIGLNGNDYILADPYLIKKDEEKLYSEKIVYLPEIWKAFLADLVAVSLV